MIAVLDYGMGNRRSVEKALRHVGARAQVTRDHDELRGAEGLVVPGVGAFPRAMESLRALGLDELLRERASRDVPILGICLGMQLGFDSSEEHGGATGLGLVPGQVRRLDPAGLKLPHIGWNEVTFTREAPLLEGLPGRCAFYHVHSYVAVLRDPHDELGVTEYGTRLQTVVQRDSFYGVQFHPEKSSAYGLRLLANFARICARRSVATLA